jgi:hypothetical protein
MTASAEDGDATGKKGLEVTRVGTRGRGPTFTSTSMGGSSGGSGEDMAGARCIYKQSTAMVSRRFMSLTIGTGSVMTGLGEQRNERNMYENTRV